MLERAKRASHIDPPASSYAIMRRVRPYRGENHGPGKDVQGELDLTPGIGEQPWPKLESGEHLECAEPRAGIGSGLITDRRFRLPHAAPMVFSRKASRYRPAASFYP